jgi:hypothetical protein
VLAAAARGLDVLPVVLWSPLWASRNPFMWSGPPRPGPYARFLAALAGRYGTQGSLWREAGVPPRPLTRWQVWNEPSIRYFWSGRGDWRPQYAALLHAAHDALRAADPRGRTVLAGLTNFSWRDLRVLYRLGAGRWFDEVAVHPYTRRAQDPPRILRRIRAVMRRAGDAGKPLLATEVGWPASLEALGRRYGNEVGERRLPRMIRPALCALARARGRLGIDSVWWLGWHGRYADRRNPWDWAGLRRLGPDGALTDTAGLPAFRRAAAAVLAGGCARPGG